MSGRPGRLAAGAVAALAFATGSARAAELELAEPALCTNVDELSFRVSRALAQPLESVTGPHFAVGIQRDAAGFHARLEISGSALEGPSGVRVLNAASCEELSDALALAIALALGSRSLPPAPSPSPASLPGSMAPVPSEPPAPAPVPASDRVPSGGGGSAAESGARLGFGLSALGDTGSVPGATLGASLGARLAWPSFELRSEALLLLPREGSVDASQPDSPGGKLSLFAAAVLACTPLSQGRSIGLTGCAGAELGRLTGIGTHVASPHEQHRPWAAARADLAARWPLPGLPLGLELVVSLAAPLLRDEFILKELGTVHRPANVVGRAGLGLNWVFE